MSRARALLLGVVLLAFVGAVVVAGRDTAPPTESVPGVQLLGPEPGESVADYLVRAQATLPSPAQGPVWALAQLDPPATPAQAAALLDGTRAARVVLRVPLARVQTALVTRAVPGADPATEFAAAAVAAADERAAAAGRAPTGSRQAAVARAEAAALRGRCACVLAVVVRADGPALRTLAGRPGVRAVHAAEPGTPAVGLAVSPLLPEQRDIVGPVPDDGPVPGS